MPTDWIIQLREQVCLSWAERCGRGTGAPPATVGGTTALADDDDAIGLRNDARFNHRDEIIAAYRAGRRLSELVTEWGVSERTILRWVGRG